MQLKSEPVKPAKEDKPANPCPASRPSRVLLEARQKPGGLASNNAQTRPSRAITPNPPQPLLLPRFDECSVLRRLCRKGDVLGEVAGRVGSGGWA